MLIEVNCCCVEKILFILFPLQIFPNKINTKKCNYFVVIHENKKWEQKCFLNPNSSLIIQDYLL